MAPFVEVAIAWSRLGSARMLRDDDFGAAFVEIGDDGITVESLVGDHAAESDAVEQGRNADRIEAWPGMRRKRTRLPSASVSASILVVMPPLERPMAWL